MPLRVPLMSARRGDLDPNFCWMTCSDGLASRDQRDFDQVADGVPLTFVVSIDLRAQAQFKQPLEFSGHALPALMSFLF